MSAYGKGGVDPPVAHKVSSVGAPRQRDRGHLSLKNLVEQMDLWVHDEEEIAEIVREALLVAKAKRGAAKEEKVSPNSERTGALFKKDNF